MALRGIRRAGERVADGVDAAADPSGPAGTPHFFERSIALEPLGDGRWRGEVRPEWIVGEAPNGGYLVCIALSALGRTLPQPDPFAVSAHFPTRTVPGPAEVRVQTIRAGRSLSTGVATLEQEGRPCMHVTATYGDLSAIDGPTAVLADRPEFPPPEGCVPAVGPSAPPLARQFDLRLTPESTMWAVGRPTGVAEMAGWIRLAGGRPPDPLSLALFADAFPPTVFNVVPMTWVPTIELTVHVRARPVHGWLQARFGTRYLISGYLEEDGELWDESGKLVALSRQLARVGRPR